MRQTELHLSAEDREWIESYRSKGVRHAREVNRAHILGILDRQCLGRRFPDRATLTAEVDAWQGRRNAGGRGIEWTFTRQDADEKMARHYIS